MHQNPRRRPEVVERHHFADGTPATVVVRVRKKRLASHFHTTRLVDGAYYREGAVPAQVGFVRVQSWPAKTTYTLILNGVVYVREDAYGASLRSLSITAGLFAKAMAKRDWLWRKAGGQP